MCTWIISIKSWMSLHTILQISYSLQPNPWPNPRLITVMAFYSKLSTMYRRSSPDMHFHAFPFHLTSLKKLVHAIAKDTARAYYSSQTITKWWLLYNDLPPFTPGLYYHMSQDSCRRLCNTMKCPSMVAVTPNCWLIMLTWTGTEKCSDYAGRIMRGNIEI